ncbi:adhesion G-protein coupled receptor D2-like [Sinocyclocheilus rhinocerous]|uniref:adhesion G-protein coupled receptor D2-like n=1 Tax=Sinocyclocheilus rhinocerous TaxID=307959 RepID=UPI0007B7C8F5|nr:PREDICTED: adhesion G-protein coupled receptor D2-like [Sinocyclocheilus rhinocerous]
MDARTRTVEDHHMASSTRQRYKYIYVKMSPVLFGVILANAVFKGMCEPTQSWSDRAERGLLDVPDSNLLIQKDAVYHLVNTSFTFEQALRYCRGQSSGLTTSGVKEDEEGARKLLSKFSTQGPVWFETNKKQNPTTHLALPKQKTILRGLSFTSKDGYARVNASFPPLSAVSVCLRVQWDPRRNDVSTVFSYAARAFVNEFQLRGKTDDRKVRLALLIQGQHHRHKAELPVDGEWHHVCVTWRSSDGFWAIYVDGETGDSEKGKARGNAKDIHGDGIFILGQDQDTFGGNFTEPYFGNLTDLSVWGEALELEQVTALHTCSQLTNHRALFRWQDWSLTVHQSVQNVSATLTCPGSLKSTEKQEEECEVFNGWPDRQPQYSTAPCTHTLPFICRVSKGVVKGPMAVMQTVERMVSNLNSLLTDDTDSVQIHSDNIKLQVQQKLLSEGSHVSVFCGLGAGNRDCISVPAENMKELQNNGFKKVTLLNTWYSSVKCLSEREENITLSPIVSDGSHRHVRTVLGSSVISSTVLADGQPISMAINFTLQHKIQNSSRNLTPICSFWDFDLMPEGGGWSTKGCTSISTKNNSTSCSCNHTTNFALLLQISEVQPNPDHQTGLQIFSLIGSGVSLCGLIFTFILFVAVGVPKSDRTTVHKNLIVALVVAQLLLIFSDWASGNQEACWLVTALLHLFFLSSFCWMLVEGLLLWSKVVSVNISEERRMKLYYVLGWGLPVVIVAVTLAATLDRYKAQQYCWLNLQSHVIWAFAGPVLFVLAVNAVVLFRVVMVTVASARRRAKMLTPSSDSKLHTLDLTWAATRPVLILLPVLGLTWLCGVLVHLSVVVAYLFITLNAFQGLYIFLVYAVYNSEVRNAIRRIQDKRKALSFTNCSQPISFLPSQKSPSASWVHSLPTHSSPESSESSTPITTSTANSLVFKNERFKEDHIVNFPLKPANRSQVVQLTAFKPSGC